MKTYLTTPPVVEAIDEIIEAAQVEPDERPAVVEASRNLFGAMRTWELEHERTDWPPLATLTALAVECGCKATRPDDVWLDRAAAVNTVIHYAKQARAHQASLN